MNYQTPQEDFWAGKFGDEYIARNKGADILATNLAMFGHILSKVTHVESVLELGPNIGLNMDAIRQLVPSVELTGVEINDTAVSKLESKGYKVIHQSILDYSSDLKYDFVFTKTVLIHIPPEYLNAVYDLMFASSSKYILVAEYYSPFPVTIEYRGHQDKLFKRDFAGELIERHPSLVLKDYGFIYSKDPLFPQDDVTWFLIEKVK